MMTTRRMETTATLTKGSSSRKFSSSWICSDLARIMTIALRSRQPGPPGLTSARFCRFKCPWRRTFAASHDMIPSS
jgi:hypothetical protein